MRRYWTGAWTEAALSIRSPGWLLGSLAVLVIIAVIGAVINSFRLV
ncbi:hypothetical protein [Dactylosporangium sp. NPDC051484]